MQSLDQVEQLAAAQTLAPARVLQALQQIATGKALQSAPYNLTAAQAQAIGVAALTGLLSTDRSLLADFLHVLLGR